MNQDNPLVVPKAGSEPVKLRAFLDRAFDYESPYRRELDEEDDLVRRYVQGDQWLLRYRGDTRRAPRFTLNEREDIPKPVQNETLAVIDNEVSRLAKRNSETYVDPSDAGDPASKAAAKIAQDVIADHLEKIRWARKRRKAIYHDVLYGTMILKSYLEQDNLDTVRVGLVGALKCPNPGSPGTPEQPEGFDDMGGFVPAVPGIPPTPACGFRMAERKIPLESMASIPPNDNIKRKATFDFGTGQGGAEYSTDHCLECGAPLTKYTPTGEEAWQQDAFGRDLGQDLPKGTAAVEIVSKCDAFFENEGIGVEPENMLWFGQETPRSLDYIKRYYRKNVEQVKVDDSKGLSISERHPNLGEKGGRSTGPKSVEGRSVYKNHVLLREFYHDRTMDFPMGRMIVMAGNVVLVDDDLYVQADKPGEEPIPKVKFCIARAFPKDGELVGQGLAIHAISLQNRINMAHSQVIDTRERHGVAGLVVTRGMKLTSPGWLKAFVGRVLQWEVDPAAPNAEPKPLDTKLMDDGVWKEIEAAIEALQRVLGTMDAEIGNAPPGVTAYSALQLLGEKASERRQQREKEIIDCFEELFGHQLRLIQRYYREPRSYTVKGNRGAETKEFLGQDLNGECGVKVREQPSYDVKTAEREALSAAMANPLFQPLFTSHYALREAGKALGIPMNVLDQDNKQEDRANSKWFAFLREQRVPIPDENLDSHAIYFQTYGRCLLSDEGIELTEKVQWDTVIPAISGWRDTLTSIQTQAALYPQIVQAQQQAVQANEAAAQQGLPAQEVPPLPPEPPQLPKSLQDSILFVWSQLLAEAGIQLSPEQIKYAGFRAAFETHHMLMEGAMGGQMPAPASGPAMAPTSAPVAA